MTISQHNNWESIIGLVSELKRCDECEIATAAVAMAYICIDTLANLARPIDKEKVTRTDFKEWVDTYLKAHPDQPYQYRGKDVYAARCALLHKYGAEAELHEEDPDTIRFAYHDGGKHQYDPNVQPPLVLIGTKSFVDDILIGIDNSLKECQKNESVRKRVEPRLVEVLQVFPYA